MIKNQTSIVWMRFSSLENTRTHHLGKSAKTTVVSGEYHIAARRRTLKLMSNKDQQNRNHVRISKSQTQNLFREECIERIRFIDQTFLKFTKLDSEFSFTTRIK